MRNNGEGLDPQFGAKISKHFDVGFIQGHKSETNFAIRVPPNDLSLGLKFFALPMKAQLTFLYLGRSILAFTPATQDGQRIKGYPHRGAIGWKKQLGFSDIIVTRYLAPV